MLRLRKCTDELTPLISTQVATAALVKGAPEAPGDQVALNLLSMEGLRAALPASFVVLRSGEVGIVPAKRAVINRSGDDPLRVVISSALAGVGT